MKRSIVFTILYCVCAALPLAAQTGAPEGMVQIPAGKFWMGRDHSTKGDADNNMPRGWRDDRPANLISVDAFYLDKYEVTNADYARFLEATGGKAPWHWPHGKVPAGDEKQAVANVNWFEATAFCTWAGKRLPTEAEWEKAARGGQDRKMYAWDDDYEPATPGAPVVPAVYNRNKAAAVGSLPPNGYGLYDMIGNVIEWTNDWYDSGYYAFMPRVNPKGPDTGMYRSVRGGGWAEGRGEKLANYYRNFSDPETRSSTIGFRCAK
jgi:formylglycine-generating enzyme required for sulfatase activity